MTQISLHQIAEAIGAKLIGENTEVSYSASFDTRSLQSGQIFFALKGNNADGHDYIKKAIEIGAAACVVSKPQQIKVPQLFVEDTKKALVRHGIFCRKMFNGVRVCVTGSCGKTSVKEMLKSVLTLHAPTLATQHSYNNDIGVPITLSQLNNKYKYSVVEIGTNAPGEIDFLANIAKPHLAIITNAGASHLEHLKSVALVAKEKGSILDHLPEKKGIAILNMDSEFFPDWLKKAHLRKAKVLTFSLHNSEADVYASSVSHQNNGMATTINFPNHSKAFLELAFHGIHQVSNALAVAVASYGMGIPISTIISGLAKTRPFTRRGQHFTGKNRAHIIDESYNANPISVKAAIDLLASYKGTRIFVFGDMAEMGKHAKAVHQNIGRYCYQKGVNYLLAYGKLSHWSAKSFGKQSNFFEDINKLIDHLSTLLSPDTTILIKGSNNMNMHYIVKACIEQEITTKKRCV